MTDTAPQTERETDRYKDTVFLPRTSFPMRAGLPQKEPELLARWQTIDLYGRMRTAAAGRPPFVLHDGPPFANGNIHIGHATQKILKDVVNRTRYALGHQIDYVPGWDCHGLPIEWKIEETYRAAGRDKDEVPVLDFRAECRAFARRWVEVQSGEFQRLGIVGAWDDPYLTMTDPAEAAIVAEIHKFVSNGLLYQGVKPVLWSPVEKTALADAEVEYHELKSPTVWVRFPVLRAPDPGLAGGAVLIWTTTPWTMPGNRAICYGDEIAYGLYRIDAVGEGSLARPGERVLVAERLADEVRAAAKASGWTQTLRLPGSALAGTVCAHPLRGRGYEHEVPLLPGAHVTEDAGTGFVHTAPGHGEEDFEIGRAAGLEIPRTVDEDGRFYAHVPLFAGLAILDPKGQPGPANGAVIGALTEAGTLFAKGSLRHQYPHSWRSRSPLIFRTTPQWFIAMDRAAGAGQATLRAAALAAIAETAWVPARGRNRIGSMVETRPDWCISRQRAWGVPIAIFVEKRTGRVLDDPAVHARIQDAFRAEGADAWYRRPAADFLGNTYDPADYEQVFDIVDVWFESGATHAFVLEARGMAWPADLYLEGSDQHRGWFQSSLLEACGTRGRAPFKTVLTHGFVLDEQGRKMSKSLGNGVEPQEVTQRSGADILRLWTASADYQEDTRLGPKVIEQATEAYRRLRNTLRYLLGALDGFTPAERVPLAEMPELERWVLHRLTEVDREIRAAVVRYDFPAYSGTLVNFCAVELSSLYFDIRKDALYCDRPDSLRRRAARTVMDRAFDTLCVWLAPVLAFTSEEAWLARHGAGTDGAPESVHLRTWPDLPAAWHDPDLAGRWERLRDLRRTVTGALERARAAKQIGSSLEAAVTLVVADAETARLARAVDWRDFAIVSAAAVTDGPAPADAVSLPDVPGLAVRVEPAPGTRCVRCRQVLTEVGSIPAHPDLCGRCADAVEALS